MSDSTDDQASGNGATSDPDQQSVGVYSGNAILGNAVKITYIASTGREVTAQLDVGRPAAENSNDEEQTRHDIREVGIHVVVFQDPDTALPYATLGQVLDDLQTINERFAQSTVRYRLADFNGDGGINMGLDGRGVPLPGGPGIDWTNGLDAGSTYNPPQVASAEEIALVAYRDQNVRTIDMFYGPFFSTATAAQLGPRGYTIAAPRYVFLSPQRTVLTAAHEALHALLNIDGHRDAGTHLLHAPTTDKAVGGTKRIGPYPGDPQGDQDTTTVRNNAE